MHAPPGRLVKSAGKTSAGARAVTGRVVFWPGRGLGGRVRPHAADRAHVRARAGYAGAAGRPGALWPGSAHGAGAVPRCTRLRPMAGIAELDAAGRGER